MVFCLIFIHETRVKHSWLIIIQGRKQYLFGILHAFACWAVNVVERIVQTQFLPFVGSHRMIRQHLYALYVVQGLDKVAQTI